MSDEAFSVYRFDDEFRNERLDGDLGEPARNQVSQGAGRPAASLHDGRGASRFRLEAPDGRSGQIVGNPVPLEIIGDEKVTGAARGEQARPLDGEAAIVDETGPLRGLDRLAGHGTPCAAIDEPPLQRRYRVLAGTKRPQRDDPCFVPPELTADCPGGDTIEASSDGETRRVDGLEWHDPPRAAVQLDRHASRTASP
jgi:hypothetical protein